MDTGISCPAHRRTCPRICSAAAARERKEQPEPRSPMEREREGGPTVTRTYLSLHTQSPSQSTRPPRGIPPTYFSHPVSHASPACRMPSPERYEGTVAATADARRCDAATTSVDDSELRRRRSHLSFTSPLCSRAPRYSAKINCG